MDTDDKSSTTNLSTVISDLNTTLQIIANFTENVEEIHNTTDIFTVLSAGQSIIKQ